MTNTKLIILVLVVLTPVIYPPIYAYTKAGLRRLFKKRKGDNDE